LVIYQQAATIFCISGKQQNQKAVNFFIQLYICYETPLSHTWLWNLCHTLYSLIENFTNMGHQHRRFRDSCNGGAVAPEEFDAVASAYQILGEAVVPLL
jgi:hypothetical protein